MSKNTHNRGEPVSGSEPRGYPPADYDSDTSRHTRPHRTRSSNKGKRDPSPPKSRSKKSCKKRKQRRCQESSSSENSSDSTESTDESGSSDSSSADSRSRASPPLRKKSSKDLKKAVGRRMDKNPSSDQVYINLLKGMKIKPFTGKKGEKNLCRLVGRL